MTMKKRPAAGSGAGKGQRSKKSSRSRDGIQGSRKPRRRRWSVQKVLAKKQGRLAGLLFFVLRCLVGDDRQLKITRPRIRAITGFYKNTITDAMRILVYAAWITVTYGNDGVFKWYQIGFLFAGSPPVGKGKPRISKAVRKYQRDPETKRFTRAVSDGSGSDPCARPRRGDLLGRRQRPTPCKGGAGPTDAPLPPAGGASAPTPATGGKTPDTDGGAQAGVDGEQEMISITKALSEIGETG